jgi:hypothetical protein
MNHRLIFAAHLTFHNKTTEQGENNTRLTRQHKSIFSMPVIAGKQ